MNRMLKVTTFICNRFLWQIHYCHLLIYHCDSLFPICPPSLSVLKKTAGNFARACICYLSCCLFAFISQMQYREWTNLKLQPEHLVSTAMELNAAEHRTVVEVFFLLPTLVLCEHHWLRQHRGLLVYGDVWAFLLTECKTNHWIQYLSWNHGNTWRLAN